MIRNHKGTGAQSLDDLDIRGQLLYVPSLVCVQGERHTHEGEAARSGLHELTYGLTYLLIVEERGQAIPRLPAQLV